MNPLLAFGEGVTGMTSFVSGLTAQDGITSTTLWDQIVPAVPLIVTIFIFAFGYRFIRRLVSRGSKGKA